MLDKPASMAPASDPVIATRGDAVGTTGDRSGLSMRSSIIEDNLMFGLLISGSDALIESSVVRSTLPSSRGGGWGAIFAQGERRP